MKWHWKNVGLNLQRFASQGWFAPLVAVLAALDAIIVFIPVEALLVSAVIVRPKHWARIALVVSVGSATGAAGCAWLVSQYGEGLVNQLFPALLQSKSWLESSQVIQEHGTWGLAVISLSPIPQQAAVVIAGLAHLQPMIVLLSVFVGRALKYLFFAWCSVHSSKFIRRHT